MPSFGLPRISAKGTDKLKQVHESHQNAKGAGAHDTDDRLRVLGLLRLKRLAGDLTGTPD